MRYENVAAVITSALQIATMEEYNKEYTPNTPVKKAQVKTMKNHETVNELNGLAVPLGLYWMPDLEPQVNMKKTAVPPRPMAKRQALTTALKAKVAIAEKLLRHRKPVAGH